MSGKIKADKKKSSKRVRKEKDKKRDRSSTGASRSSTTPSKRVKAEVSTMKVEESAPSSKIATGSKIIKIKNDADDVSQLRVKVEPSNPASDPVVVSFTSGLPSSMAANSKADSSRTIRFEDDNEDDNGNLTSPPPVFTWTKARKSSSRGRLIHGSDDTCTYISSNEGRGHDGRLTKFYIGIYHKPTSTVKFIPASEKGTVFNMNQSVTSYHDSKGMDFRNLSIAERRRMVFESFGSQKKKKVMKSQQANIVEMRSVVGAGEGMMKSLGKQMDGNMMSESNMKVMEELKNQKDSSGKMLTAVDKAYAQARRSFLPPFDEHATDPYKVYDSQEVAGEEGWAQISRVVEACLRKDDEWKEAFQLKRPWPESTKVLLDQIKSNKKKASYRLKTIVLVNYLVRFHTRATKMFLEGSNEEVAKYLGLPREVSDRFLLLFYTPSFDHGRSGFATSKQLKDRRVVYTLVMYLLAHGKKMKVGSIEKLCEDMMIETKEAMSLYREAGCICVKKSMISVSLSVPLTFPPPKRAKKT